MSKLLSRAPSVGRVLLKHKSSVLEEILLAGCLLLEALLTIVPQPVEAAPEEQSTCDDPAQIIAPVSGGSTPSRAESLLISENVDQSGVSQEPDWGHPEWPWAHVKQGTDVTQTASPWSTAKDGSYDMAAGTHQIVTHGRCLTLQRENYCAITPILCLPLFVAACERRVACRGDASAERRTRGSCSNGGYEGPVANNPLSRANVRPSIYWI